MKVNRLTITLLLLFMLLLHCNFIYSQDKSLSPFFYSFNYRTGENKPHREVIKNLTYPYRGFDLKMGWQTVGNRDWQVAYRYPSLGIGVNWNTFNTKILGEPIAAYFFTNFPQITTDWFRIDLEIDLGLSYGINPYNQYTNPKNMATGSSLNAIFGIYLEQSFHVTPVVDFFASEGLTHYSNGAIGWPNLGLNIPSLKFGFRHYYQKPQYVNKNKKIDFDRTFQLNTYIGYGSKKLFAPIPTYREFLISPSLYYRIGYKRRLGLGFEIAYNESKQGLRFWDPYPPEELITYAIHFSHEYLIERFTILTQLGLYLGESPSDYNINGHYIYERLGLGFYVFDNVRLSLCLKAHYIKAEFVEFGLVYDINFK